MTPNSQYHKCGKFIYLVYYCNPLDIQMSSYWGTRRCPTWSSKRRSLRRRRLKKRNGNELIGTANFLI